MKPIFQILPSTLRDLIQSLPRPILGCLEEIRVRQDRPLEVITSEQAWFVSRGCQLTVAPKESIIPSRDDCLKMLNLLSNHSLYTMEEELRRGYVTIEGGHRIGLVGTVVVEEGRVKYLRDITGFNVRVAREIKGVGEQLLASIFTGQGPKGVHDNIAGVHNVLIVSPPQCGKTTLIRDLARLASTGGGRFSSFKVGIVDERSEIAGCINGVPQHDVGPRTDVLDSCPKAEGMMMMIRSMSPHILVVDEIGSAEDCLAMIEAIHAGVNIFSTVHGHSVAEINNRPTLGPLLKANVFTRIIVLSRKNGPGTIEGIYDQAGKLVPMPSQSIAPFTVIK